MNNYRESKEHAAEMRFVALVFFAISAFVGGCGFFFIGLATSSLFWGFVAFAVISAIWQAVLWACYNGAHTNVS
jgi:hypothetical protein